MEFNGGRGYIGISDVDGHLRVGADYLNTGSRVHIYLDVIHALVHVKQFMEGKKIFNLNLIYVDRAMELEACRHAVDEARNLGMSDKQILNYLRTDRLTGEDLKNLATELNVRVKSSYK